MTPKNILDITRREKFRQWLMENSSCEKVCCTFPTGKQVEVVVDQIITGATTPARIEMFV